MSCSMLTMTTSFSLILGFLFSFLLEEIGVLREQLSIIEIEDVHIMHDAVYNKYTMFKELADKIAAAGFLVVVPDLLYGDYFSYDPQFNREGWLKKHGENCLKNGRPDREFLYWRWDPRGYELPLFDAGKFLNMMHGKVWALIGDSISRNHVQLLICILSTRIKHC
ncbi:protein YLS7 isoform X2 [Arachis hypogaea]|uniref:protein YLS7 isoform X2 n=1 Tax=Arachis hypogaea TaxID=3818 RepID=UPI003B222B09